MTPYRLEQIDPHRIQIPACRAQYAGWAVMQGNKLVGLFPDERTADSYCRRLNAWQRQNQRSTA